MIALRRRPRLPAPPEHGAVALAAAALTVERAGRAVVDDVTLDVRHGEVLALVGPNGAGKSTLLAALCGDLRPAAGTIRVASEPLDAFTPRELALRRSMLPQKHTLSFPFTAGDVVRMGRVPWAGTPLEDDDDHAVATALRDADAVPFADRPFTALSGGEQARVALARVLAQRAATVLLDEPTAALDIRHQELVFGVARREAARGHAVVVVVHDLDLAAAYADRVALLAEGRLAACGPSADVLTADRLTEVYRHDIEVLPHPRTGRPLVLPRRGE
ncbi:heme ABC transporter ATP-binding protein [Actinomadura atramentaria]|uniref:heme ABC transporter ATP-binding protein n=1 Tax=Actinomadura atramentaria TaxID=1990 RepID=UPI00036E6931|nr:heme ABC transporter ATP-binding protein [Actinomadura atramentaria]